MTEKNVLLLTRMVWLIAFGSPDNFSIDEKNYASKSITTYQILFTVTTLAAETKSIGLPAFAQLSWFLHRHLDYFILT